MLATDLALQRFDPQTATEADWTALNTFNIQIQAESFPEDPPEPLATTIHQLRDIPTFADRRVWVIWRENAVIARGMFAIWSQNSNRHLADFWIGVLPAERRHGLARRLLAPIVESAQREERRLLVSWTNDRAPAGDAFMARLNGQMGLETHTNQLQIADVDPARLRAWQAQAQERAAGFTLVGWDGPFPDADMPAMIEVRKGINLAPQGSIEWEDHVLTVDELREIEASLARRHMERWTLAVREDATGTLAGYTDVFWSPLNPELLWQEDTAVLPPYRNRGIGRWLKAAMLEKVLRERPQVRYVRTGNADSNAPMLKINTELGYRPYLAERIWQVETAQAAAYLDRI